LSSSPTSLRLEGKDLLTLIIAGHNEVDPDDRDEAVAVMRDLATHICYRIRR
jgi:hypothetical protein